MEFKNLSEISHIRNENIINNTNSSLIYVTTSNILPNKKGIDLNLEMSLDKSGRKFYKNDILVSNIRPYFKKIWKANMDGITSNDVLIFYPNEEVNLDYLYFVLAQDDFFDYATKTSKGTKMPRGDKAAINKFKILLPKLNIQMKIASILSNLDSKIEKNNKIISNLESRAQAIFKSWFVDFGPFQDGNFVESELGMIPEGWEVKELGEVADCKLGGTPSRKKREFWNGDIPWINSGEVNKDRIIEPSEYITEDGLKNSATKLLKRKTTLVAITGATLGQVSLLEIDCCTNQSIIGIEPNEKIPYEYIYLFIKNNINKIISNQTGAAQQHINLNDIRTSKIIIPQSRIMTEYVKIVSLLMSKVEKNYFENTKLAELRDALLPKLMAGEIDVSNIKIEGEEVKNE